MTDGWNPGRKYRRLLGQIQDILDGGEERTVRDVYYALESRGYEWDYRQVKRAAKRGRRSGYLDPRQVFDQLVGRLVVGAVGVDGVRDLPRPVGERELVVGDPGEVARDPLARQAFPFDRLFVGFLSAVRGRSLAVHSRAAPSAGATTPVGVFTDPALGPYLQRCGNNSAERTKLLTVSRVRRVQVPPPS